MSNPDKEVNSEYEDSPILTPEQNKERLRKIREARLPKPEDIIEGKAPEPDEKMKNEPEPDYVHSQDAKKE